MGNRHNKQRIPNTNGSSSRSFVPILCSKNSIKDVAAVPSSIRFDHHRLHNEDQDDQYSSSSASSSSIITDELEPVSPKVGCMGQVNKRSNRVAARRSPPLPHNMITNKKNRRPSANNTTNAVVVAVNYSKLGRLFSGKKLLLGSAAGTASPALGRPIAASSTAMTTTVTHTRSKSWVGPRKNLCHQTKGKNNSNHHHQQLNFIREMDPPLPVILPKKKLQAQQEEEDQDGEQGHEAEGGRSSLLWKRRFGDVSALKTLEINQLNTVHCRRRPPPQPLTV